MSEHFSKDPISGHLLLTPSPLCMQKINEPECCYGVAIMSGNEKIAGEDKANWFNGKPCSQLIEESINCPAEECYAPLSAYIINTCKKDNCSAAITAFKIKVDSLNGVGAAVSGPPAQ